MLNILYLFYMFVIISLNLQDVISVYCVLVFCYTQLNIIFIIIEKRWNNFVKNK